MQDSPLEEPQSHSEGNDSDITKEEAKPLFFPVSITKLIILSICTIGIYEVYWFYKNWEIIKQREYSKISPFWRAIFSAIGVKANPL